jgi:cytochrome c-type biogenesis protein CcmH/NrfF
MAGRDARAAARRVLALGAALAALGVPAAGAAEKASLPDIEDEVMCVECGTALNVSQSAVADDEREYIRELIAQGKSKQAIKDALVAEYGRTVLATPDDAGFGIAVYIVPPLLALLALTGVALTASRWRRTPQRPAPKPLEPAEEDRLDRDMAGYDL